MPRKQLSPSSMPMWLNNLDASTNFNRNDVLNDSIYYPGSYIDGAPLQAYGGVAHSFVYVDYDCEKKTIIENLPKIGGYEPIFIKEVSKQELSPNPVVQVTLRNSDFHGSEPHKSVIELLESYESKLTRHIEPYCIWSVMQRKTTTNPAHGPERFSMLSICGDGVTTYGAIYNSNLICPYAIIINAADIEFGGNWTLFEKKDGAFERVVMANPAGIPRYLFTWERYAPPGYKGWESYRNIEMYWSEYKKKVVNRGYLNIWTTNNA